MTRTLPADNAGGQNSFRFFTRFRTRGMTRTLPADNAGGQNSFRFFFITRFWTYGMTQAMPADNAGSRESFRFFITLFWAYGMTQAMPADNAGSGNHSVFYYPVLGLRNDSGYAGGQCRQPGIIPLFFITLFWAYGMTQAMPADKTGGP